MSDGSLAVQMRIPSRSHRATTPLGCRQKLDIPAITATVTCLNRALAATAWRMLDFAGTPETRWMFRRYGRVTSPANGEESELPTASSSDSRPLASQPTRPEPTSANSWTAHCANSTNRPS